MDPVFEQEQDHLSETYASLLAIEVKQREKLGKIEFDAGADKAAMAEELTLDMADFDSHLETLASIESLNRIIDSYNITHNTAEERLAKVELLLRQPYFAKVVLALEPDGIPREIYLGAAGMSDDSGHVFIVDWRSPVAETYYNQSSGPTSYNAHGRTIHADLQLRRQFDIERDQLRAYFDTTVAIEDPLLLKALSRSHSAHMKAITATIQKEQNQVIRHEDVPALLVRGIAGSGKTSVLLQRIAYLLYQQRGNLRPDQLHLISPSPVFSRYIAYVLPDMGETNPFTETWAELARGQGIPVRGKGEDETTIAMLDRIDEVCQDAQLLPEDCRSVCFKDEVLIPAGEVVRIVKRFANVKSSQRKCARVTEELHDRLDAKIARDAASDKVHAIINDMDLDEQCRRFGYPIDGSDEEALREAGQVYLSELYKPVYRQIEDACWISLRRLAQRLIGGRGLKPLERAYLKLVFAGTGNEEARYVMIDEVQDYTAAQLRLIVRCYPKAHFLLLGDPNQAIYKGTASFDEIKEVFERGCGQVAECALTTSYRSTPEITDLFARLMDEKERIEVSSVQREGQKPQIIPCADNNIYCETLIDVLNAAKEKPQGLTAIIAADDRSLRGLRAFLGEHTLLFDEKVLSVIDGRKKLPDHGLILLSLPMAKGLEFDRVIIPDADGDHYGDGPTDRCRLYTALSRATEAVTVLSSGALSPLLRDIKGSTK